MQVEESAAAPACLPTPEFLSAEELVSLRKPAEETQPAIGEKLYNRFESLLEEQALKSALAGYKDTLNKKRAGRICDLIQAVWDPELNAVTTSKLKGKFTQHMGRLTNGKYILAPEEAVFLLENNCIEIMNGELPMSTEEAFSLILKGNLAHEKYQTYSHLSKLGYVVVVHQTETGATEGEKEMNVDNCSLNKKRPVKEPAEGEPEKKRLTFTGALSEESELRTLPEASRENSGNEMNLASSTGEANITDKSQSEIAEKASENVQNVDSVAEEQNVNGERIGIVAKDIQSDLDQINHSLVSRNELEANLETKGSEISKEMNSSCNYNASDAQTEVITNSNGVDSQNPDESAENDQLQNNLSLKSVENQDFLDSNSQSSKIVDVMEVETDAETSCTTSEVSRDIFDSNVNATSQDSCISVNNDGNAKGDANGDSNFECDVLSMSGSSSDEDEEVLTVDVGSVDNPVRQADDEVTLLEVTKKEVKPLAVIDLLSDDDDDETDMAINVVDDDIIIVEESTRLPIIRPAPPREIHPKKLKCYKKEEGNSDVSSSKVIPPLTVQFPDLFKKQVVCVARPPLHLLPNHVKPNKEAYILKMKPSTPDQPYSGERVWNSFRDMQSYQQQRRQNRHRNNNSPRGPFSAHQPWNDRNARNHERFRRSGARPHNLHSPNVISNSGGPPGLPVDFNRNVFTSNSFQNNASLPTPAAMNCEVTVKEDTSESMVGSISQSSHSNNLSLSSGMPSNPLMNPMIPSDDFMAGFQRNAFSGMGNVSNQLMAELQRTCFTVATNMLSTMLNRNPSLAPNASLPMFPPGLNPFGSNLANGFGNSFNPPVRNEYFSMPQQNFSDQQRRFHRGRPFPCRYRNITNKRSWSDVRSAVCGSSSDSDIEEMPISPKDILWQSKDVCPLVKSGVCYPVGSVFKFLQITQKAKVTNKYAYSEKSLPSNSNLKISFDVYTPGFTYKKTSPQIPKYRIVVQRSTDPFPKYADIVILQRKWKDGAALLIAVNDNGDISFQSFNSVSLPSLTPHED